MRYPCGSSFKMQSCVSSTEIYEQKYRGKYVNEVKCCTLAQHVSFQKVQSVALDFLIFILFLDCKKNVERMQPSQLLIQ